MKARGTLEHAIQPWVAFAIVPIFGFANAGVSLLGLGAEVLRDPLTVGVAAGLFLGKLVGVFGTAAVAIRLGVAPMPMGASWPQLAGVALLCGIGFTMSLFIGALAFPGSGAAGCAKIASWPVLCGAGLSGAAAGAAAGAGAGCGVRRLAGAWAASGSAAGCRGALRPPAIARCRRPSTQPVPRRAGQGRGSQPSLRS